MDLCQCFNIFHIYVIIKKVFVKKGIVWLPEDESKNLHLYDLSFSKAKEAILNSMTLRLRNIDGDYTYIGPNDDLSEIYLVYAIADQGFTRIKFARRATPNEVKGFFDKIKGIV